MGVPRQRRMAGRQRRHEQEAMAAAVLPGGLHQIQAAGHVAAGEHRFRMPAHLARTVHHALRAAHQLGERGPIFQRAGDPLQVVDGGFSGLPRQGAHAKSLRQQFLDDVPADKAGRARHRHGAAHCAKPASCGICG